MPLALQVPGPFLALLAAAALGLAVAVIALSLVLARRTRELAEHVARLASVEAEKDAAIREEVERQVAAEERRLAEEHRRREEKLARREREVRARQQELADRRVRLEERAAILDGRAEELAERAGALDARASRLDQREQEIGAAEEEIRRRLEEVAGMTTEQARAHLLGEVEKEVRGEVARLLQKVDEQAREAAEEAARARLLASMATLRGSVVGEGTITIVRLPNDEMKGRVIGREGRNIRALEHALGVDLLVDDTPGAILLSSWDPLRRTIAARALEKLVEDGRIHPARIEEIVEKTREEVDDVARERGEKIAFELGVTQLHDRLVLLLGRLSFFHDHGQDLLSRSREVALLAGDLAASLRVGGEALRRAGLLHEIARADKDPPLAHVAIASADLATRYGEPAEVTGPIRALAQPPDAPRTPEGVVLVTARRAVLGRPGARRENLARHMERLRQVEEIALSREGIERAVAVRAGRELRVHVRSENVSDDEAILLARDIAREITDRVDYPDQVRVLVIRETRAVSYAV